MIFEYVTEQMDLIRYSTMNMSSINQTTEKIIDVKRRLGRYVRDIDKAQEILLRIVADKKKKGRTFGAYKDSEIWGGFNCRWSQVELIILLYTLIFTNIYGPTLRFDFTVNLVSSGNLNVIHRVFNALIVAEELDILFIADIKSRSAKSIRDKLLLCGEYEGSDKNSAIGQI